MLKTLLVASCAGIIGTGIGGIIGILFSHSSQKALSSLLAFASGVMISIVCFDLIPEALSLSSVLLTSISIFLGILVVQWLNILIDRITHSEDTHIELEDLRHQNDLLSTPQKQSMLRSGLVMFAAISLHNLPEGMAIGSATSHDANMGLTLAFLIALHNIPEGMSIGVPLIEGGMNKWKAVILTALSGAPTLIGGLLGAVLGKAGDLPIAISLALAAGAMLYVTFCEVLPQAILLHKGRRPALFAIIGLVLGFISVNAFM
ncbi:MAG: ZIP family metal transporter [Cellulosilyticaceae bacterium]